jgi:hypothetical protein
MKGIKRSQWRFVTRGKRLYRSAASTSAPVVQAPPGRRRDAMVTTSGLVLLGALAAAALGQGAVFSTMQWLVAALIAVAFAVAIGARPFSVAEACNGVVIAGLSLAIWALLRAAQAGTLATGSSWALFGAGTAAAVSVCRRLDTATRETLLGGAFAVGTVVAATGWLGIALHERSWGLPSQGLWRAASTLTYANATAAFLVPLALVALSRLAAAPRSAYLSLAATSLLAGAGATLSRAGAAAFIAGFLVLCGLQGTRVVVRAAAGPTAGAGLTLLGLVPSMSAAGPARPLVAAIALAAGLVLAVAMQRIPGRVLGLAAAGAALAVGLIVIYQAPGVRSAMRALAGARFNLASPDRTGETGAALRLIGQHPLAGVGPGRATLRWIGPGGGLRVDRYVHDEYLQVLTDLGVVGAALLAIFMAAVGRLLWRARVDLPHPALWAGAVAGVTAFAVHSGFDFLWSVPAIPLTVAVFVGLAAPSTIRPAARAP